MSFTVRFVLSALLLALLGISPQVALAAAERVGSEKPAGLDDAGWASLQSAVRQSIGPQVKLTLDVSGPVADGAAEDQFGFSVALAGDTALIGAYLDDVGANRNQGSAYVYLRNYCADFGRRR